MKFILLSILILGCSSRSNDESNDSKKIKNNVDELQVNQTTIYFIGDDDDEFFFMEVTSVKNYQNGKKHGDWKFYDNDGNMAKIEKYEKGKLIK